MSQVRFLKSANSYEEIIAVPLPETTKSYQALSNEDLVKNLKEVLKHYKLEVTKEQYQLARNNQQLFGALTVKDSDSEIQKCIGFKNSYDKSLPVGIVAGAEVIICSNLMFEGEIKKVRKHTTNMYDDISNVMTDAVRSLEKSFGVIKSNKEDLKLVKVDKTLLGEFVVDMYLKEELLSVNQMTVFRDEWLKKELVLDVEQRRYYSQNAWDIMNHITEALKKEHVSTRMEKQVQMHDFVIEKFLR